MDINQTIDSFLPDLYDLRRTLWNNPDLSGHEEDTRKILMDFIQDHTHHTVHNIKRWFYVQVKGTVGDETIAIRADHDAIQNSQGEAFHGCGHDGHSTILAGLAWLLDKQPVEPNVILIFQHSEENGIGAREIVPTLKGLGVNRIYGLHNFPGAKEGQIISRVGTFFCASLGMQVKFQGHQSHAAQPEESKNPSFAIADMLKELEALSTLPESRGRTWQGEDFDHLVQATVVHAQVGDGATFGISPGTGILELTLRADKTDELKKMTAMVEDILHKEAEAYDLQIDLHYTDIFPETSNSQAEIDRIRGVLESYGETLEILPDPFRPSEDFGWYLQSLPGCFVGLGSGEDHLPLHHDDFEFPDEIIKPGVKFFYSILAQGQ